MLAVPRHIVCLEQFLMALQRMIWGIIILMLLQLSTSVLKIFYLCLQVSIPTPIMVAVSNLFVKPSINILEIGVSTSSQSRDVLVMLSVQLACHFSDAFFQLSQLNCQFGNVMVMLTSQFSNVMVILTSQFSNVMGMLIDPRVVDF